MPPLETGTALDELPEQYRPQEQVKTTPKSDQPALETGTALDELPDQYRPRQGSDELTVARHVQRSTGEDIFHLFGRKGAPFISSAVGMIEEKNVHAAQRRIGLGESTEADLHLVAQHEALQQRDAQDQQTWTGTAIHSGMGLLRTAGEIEMGGSALGAAGFAQAPSKGLLQSIGRVGVRTAAAPSMYSDQWIANNREANRAPDDMRGLPSAFGLGMVQTAIIGSLGNVGERTVSAQGVKAFLARQAVRGAVGTAEAQAGDAAFGIAQDVVRQGLPEWTAKKSRYGAIGELVQEGPESAARSVTMSMLTFAAMGAIHEAAHGRPQPAPQAQQGQQPAPAPPVPPSPVVEALVTALDSGAKQGRSKEATAQQIQEKVVVPLQEAVKQNPNLDRVSAQKLFEAEKPGPIKDLGMAAVGSLREPGPQESPTPSPTPPHPLADWSPEDIAALAKGLGLASGGKTAEITKRLTDSLGAKNLAAIAEARKAPSTKEPSKQPSLLSDPEIKKTAERFPTIPETDIRGALAMDHDAAHAEFLKWAGEADRLQHQGRPISDKEFSAARDRASLYVWVADARARQPRSGPGKGPAVQEAPASPPEAPQTALEQQPAHEPPQAAPEAPAQTWQHTGTKFKTNDEGQTEFTSKKSGKRYTVAGYIEGEGNNLHVQVFDMQGKEVGDVLFDRKGVGKNGKPTGKDYSTPGVTVKEGSRREGVAEAMYDFAHEELQQLEQAGHPLGGKIVPAKDQSGGGAGGETLWRRNAEKAAEAKKPAEAPVPVEPPKAPGVEGSTPGPQAAPPPAPPEPTPQEKPLRPTLEQLRQRQDAGGEVSLQDAFLAAGLNAREQHVLQQRLQGRSHEEIAADPEMGKKTLSRQRVEQIEKKANEKLGVETSIDKGVNAEQQADAALDMIERGKGVSAKEMHADPETVGRKTKQRVTKEQKQKSNAADAFLAAAEKAQKQGHSKEAIQEAARAALPDAFKEITGDRPEQATAGAQGSVRGSKEVPPVKNQAGSPESLPGGIREAPPATAQEAAPPEHLKALAHEIRQMDRAAVAEGNDVLTETRRMLKEFGGDVSMIGLERYDDPGKIRGLDEVAQYWQNRGRTELADPNALFDLLKRGNRKPLAGKEIQAKAQERYDIEKEIENARQEASRSGHAAASAEETLRSGEEAGQAEGTASEGVGPEDSSFDFGANEPAPAEPAERSVSPEQVKQLDRMESKFGLKPEERSAMERIIKGEGTHADEDLAVGWKNRATSKGMRPPPFPWEFGKPLTEAERRMGSIGGGQEDAPGSPERPLRTTALANEQVDLERRKDQREQILSAARRADPQVWGVAMARMLADPQADAKLVTELSKKVRTVSDVESALLLHRKVALENEYDRALHEVLEAYKPHIKKTLDAITLDEMNAREKNLSNKIDEFHKIIRQVGTEQGRAFRWRAVLLAEDYSLAGMIRRASAAKGSELTPAEKAQIGELQTRIEAMQKQLDAAQAQLSQSGKGIESPAYAGWRKAAVDEARATREFREQIGTYREQNQPLGKRLGDILLKIRVNEVISGLLTPLRIGGASLSRFVTSPLEEVAGAALSQVPGIARIAAMAPREGRGMNLAAEKASLYEGLAQGMKDAWAKIRYGKSELDEMHGADSPRRTWLDVQFSLHDALKAPAERAEYTRSLLKRIDAGAAKGEDVTSPAALLRLQTEAYKDGQAAKFRQQNWLVEAYNKTANDLRDPKQPGMAQAAGLGMKLFAPVFRIPTNLAFEVANHIVGAPIGGGRAVAALARGLENLKPAEAESIMRQMKKGSVGGVALLIGYYLSQNFGGYYSGKRKDSDIQAEEARIGGVTIPAAAMHNPMMQTVHFAATVRRAQDRMVKGKAQGAAEGAAEGVLGLVDTVPLVRETQQGAGLTSRNAHERGWYFGEMAKSFLVPQFFQWIAGRTDTDAQGKPIQRKPGTTWQHVETGVPGLRQNVPIKR